MATKMTWDDELDANEAAEQAKENDFVLLPEGEYDFTVKKFEKDFYTARPDSKIPSCPVARIHLLVKTDDGEAAYFRENLFLYDGNKWQLFQFFTCLGLRKHGDGSRKMPWDQVEGAKGRVFIKQRTWTDKNRQTRSTNAVKRWLEPVEQSAETDENEDDYS